MSTGETLWQAPDGLHTFRVSVQLASISVTPFSTLARCCANADGASQVGAAAPSAGAVCACCMASNAAPCTVSSASWAQARMPVAADSSRCAAMSDGFAPCNAGGLRSMP